MPEQVVVPAVTEPAVTPVVPAPEPVVVPEVVPQPTPQSQDDEVILRTFPGMIERDGDEFVFKPKPIERDGQTIYPTTAGYRAKSAREVLEKINEGIVEKDSTISRYKTEGFRRHTQVPDQPKLAVSKVETPVPAENPRQAYENLRTQTFRQLLSETGVDPKYVSYTPANWQTLEQEIGAVNAIDIRQSVRSLLSDFEKRVDQQWNQYQITQANTQLAENATDTILDYIQENYPEMSEDEFSRTWGEAFEDKAVFSQDGRLRPERLYQSFIRVASSQHKKNGKSPLAAKLEEDKNLLKNLPPGIRVEGGGAPAPAAAGGGSPKGPEPKNIFEASQNVKSTMFKQ